MDDVDFSKQITVLASGKVLMEGTPEERYRVLHNPGGGYSGPWRNAEVPYMVEPADALTRRDTGGVVFVGPAQSGKTAVMIEARHEISRSATMATTTIPSNTLP